VLYIQLVHCSPVTPRHSQDGSEAQDTQVVRHLAVAANVVEMVSRAYREQQAMFEVGIVFRRLTAKRSDGGLAERLT